MRWSVAGVAMLAAGCSATADVKQSAYSIDQFHRQMDAQQFDAIYAAADPAFKARSTSAGFNKFLAAVHRKMGTYAAGSRSSWSVNYTPTGTFLTVHFAATYANGSARETFTFRANDPQQALVGYNISSPALVLN